MSGSVIAVHLGHPNLERPAMANHEMSGLGQDSRIRTSEWSVGADLAKPCIH
ncbi:hypothetical protein ACFVUS_04075 [Nocardia sp. NPDC058058]|uniref:hypothetical protein n=1 Tax=Nocardia sp. NPDC058058 TaxID=3346317 RepID=UPI0036D9A616